MSHPEPQLWDLLEQTYEMPFGSAQNALLEQVIAHADAQQLLDVGFAARLHATTAYFHGAEPVKAFVTFSWCLTEFDRDPVRHSRHQHRLLWAFKYMVSGMTRFPAVPLPRTYDVLDDMRRRWQETGHSQHAVYAYRHLVARHVGDLDAAGDWYDKWCATPRDQLSDCVGCDPTAKVSWLSQRLRDEEAIELAEGVLSGRLTCSEQPQGILTALLKPYLRTRRLEQARDAHRRAYRLHRTRLNDLGDIADHVEFCALTGNAARGLEILERHLGWLDRAPSPYAAMRFAAAGAVALRQAESVAPTSLTLTIPAASGRPAEQVTAERLRARLTRQAVDLATQFDARNQSTYQSTAIQDVLSAEPIVEDLALSPVPPRPRTSPARAGADVAPAPAAVPVPDVSTVEELLDLADDHMRRGRLAEALAAWAAVDERYAAADLTIAHRARRAEGRGIAHATANELDDAEQAWREAVDLFTEAGDTIRPWVARCRLGQVLCVTGRGEQGLPMVVEAVEYLLTHAEPDQRYAALMRLSTARLALGQTEEALRDLERAQQWVAESLSFSAPADLHLQRALALGRAGRTDEARTAAQAAVTASRDCGYPDGVVRGSLLLAVVAEQQADDNAAVVAYEEALAASTDVELNQQVRLSMARLLAWTPRAGEVVGDLADAVAEATATGGHQQQAAELRHVLAGAYLNSGRPLDSAELAEEALAWYLANDAPNSPAVLGIRRLLAAAYRRLGTPDEAIEQLEELLAHYADPATQPQAGRIAEELGDILSGMDRDGAAADRYRQAARGFATAGLIIDQCRAQRLHARALHWSRDPAGAEHALREADRLSATLPETDQGRWETAVLEFDGARILASLGHVDEAIERAARSVAGFRALNAVRQAEQAENLQKELMADRG
jgi:tetratricopeptide (TPR) repeat protein